MTTPNLAEHPVTCPSTSKEPSSPLVEQTIPQNWPLDLPSCFTDQDLPANHSSPLCFRSTWPKNPRGKAPNKIQTLMPGPSFWLAQSNFVYRFEFFKFSNEGLFTGDNHTWSSLGWSGIMWLECTCQRTNHLSPGFTLELKCVSSRRPWN